jgi:hypothetical protein
MNYANATETSLPTFVKRIESAVVKCWTTVGEISCKLHKLPDESYQIMYYPSIIELIGGPRDGARDFAGFYFNIGRFNKVFDKPGAKIALNCMYKSITEHLLFNGTIDGHKVELAILVAPPDGEKSLSKVHYTNVKEF